jgi:hypothetical protein
MLMTPSLVGKPEQLLIILKLDLLQKNIIALPAIKKGYNNYNRTPVCPLGHCSQQ